MTDLPITELIDQHRWFLNNGIMTDSIKNQLFFYGSLIHKDVQFLKVDIDVQKKTVQYEIFLPKKVLERIDVYEKLKVRTDIIGLWRFRRMLKKEGNLNFDSIINKFVVDYCGPKWSAIVKVTNASSYVEEDQSGQDKDGWSFDQQSDNR